MRAIILLLLGSKLLSAFVCAHKKEEAYIANNTPTAIIFAVSLGSLMSKFYHVLFKQSKKSAFHRAFYTPVPTPPSRTFPP